MAKRAGDRASRRRVRLGRHVPNKVAFFLMLVTGLLVCESSLANHLVLCLGPDPGMSPLDLSRRAALFSMLVTTSVLTVRLLILARRSPVLVLQIGEPTTPRAPPAPRW